MSRTHPLKSWLNQRSKRTISSTFTQTTMSKKNDGRTRIDMISIQFPEDLFCCDVVTRIKTSNQNLKSNKQHKQHNSNKQPK